MLSRRLDESGDAGPDLAERRRWMGVLARAGTDALERAWRELAADLRCEPVRPPEVGLVMVRGRAGGNGQRFNLGEMTVTRAAVRVAGGAVGHAYVKGRAKRQAELAAAFDALLQDPARRAEVLAAVVEPLAAAEAARRGGLAARAAATKVDFFTMVRGEG